MGEVLICDSPPVEFARMHVMAKEKRMGNVAENSGRAGWHLSMVLPLSTAPRVGESVTSVVERYINN